MEWRIASPTGTTTLTAMLDDAGELRYRVDCDGATVITDARLGLFTATHDLTTRLVAVAATEPETIVDTFVLPHGKRRESTTTMTEQAVRFASADGTRFEIVMRAADDGVAFRYRSPDPWPPTLVVAEATELRFAAPGRAWIQQLQPPGHAEPAYEETFTNGTPLDDPGPSSGWFLPALFEVDGRWVLLTEADADAGYTLAQLAGPEDGTYRIAFPHPDEALGLGAAQPTVAGRWQTPWRVAIVGSHPGVVFESDLVRHLSRPTRLPDAGWIRPGRAAWSWWSDHDSPRNMATQRAYVDFAAEMGWEHILVDANWNLVPEDEIVALVAYAADRDVGVVLWYNSGGPNNAVTEQPRDRMYDRAVRLAEFARLEAWGVAGVKVDFFHTDKQAGVRHYLDILEDAAAHRVMVIFHGCTIPRGWDRTWPHMMTMEGVRGAEQYSFRDGFPAEAPELNTILPFTRNVPGSMDYTPVTFSHGAYPHLTTSAHELALAVVFESAIQHFADSAASYRSQPDAVVDFLRTIPTVWDESRWLEGEPGTHVVVARRHGSLWFVAGLNARTEPHTISLVPPVPAGAWRRLLVADGHQSNRFSVSERSGFGAASLEVTMAPRGGFAARFVPAG